MRKHRVDPDGYDNWAPIGVGETDLMRNVQRLATTVWPDLRDLAAAERCAAMRGVSEDWKSRTKRFGPMQTPRNKTTAR